MKTIIINFPNESMRTEFVCRIDFLFDTNGWGLDDELCEKQDEITYQLPDKLNGYEFQQRGLFNYLANGVKPEFYSKEEIANGKHLVSQEANK